MSEDTQPKRESLVRARAMPTPAVDIGTNISPEAIERLREAWEREKRHATPDAPVQSEQVKRELAARDQPTPAPEPFIRTVRILDHTLTVADLPRGRGDNCTDLMGRANMSLQRIEVGEDLPPEGYYSTLLHEIVHVIHHMYGIEMTETQVNVFAYALFSLLKNNPELTRRIAALGA